MGTTHSTTRFSRVFKVFARDDRGVISVVYGIGFAVALLSAAVAVDYGRMVTERWADQRALDAAVLAASDSLGGADEQVAGEQRAKAFYKANRTQNPNSDITGIQLDSANGQVAAKTETPWHATLLKGLKNLFPGIADDRQISVTAQVAKGSGSVELALVLDNSGSMAGTHIEDLRMAANDLVSTLFAGSDGSGRVKVGVVPFAASVNVGAGARGASWIDGAGIAPTHSENFDTPQNRLALFDEMGVAWRGCVEARSNGLDVTDTPPTTSNPASMFVPMFAPDEPGEAGSNSLGYNNSYLNDDGGQCEPYERYCESYSRRGNCRQWRTVTLPEPEAQERTCKYSGASPSGALGPNAMCTTQAILPLNSTKSDVQTAITNMQASGNTNIKEGVAWGWRVLSPGAPFTEGRAYGGGEGNRKIMIVMTDGENWYNAASTHNASVYAAHGFAAKGRLGSTFTRAGYTSFLNARTTAVCENAKAAGITVYTIAFRLENDPTTRSLLRSCASGADYFFTASDGGTLIQSFRNIGREINTLRLAG